MGREGVEVRRRGVQVVDESVWQASTTGHAERERVHAQADTQPVSPSAQRSQPPLQPTSRSDSGPDCPVPPTRSPLKLRSTGATTMLPSTCGTQLGPNSPSPFNGTKSTTWHRHRPPKPSSQTVFCARNLIDSTSPHHHHHHRPVLAHHHTHRATLTTKGPAPLHQPRPLTHFERRHRSPLSPSTPPSPPLV